MVDGDVGKVAGIGVTVTPEPPPPLTEASQSRQLALKFKPPMGAS